MSWGRVEMQMPWGVLAVGRGRGDVELRLDIRSVAGKPLSVICTLKPEQAVIAGAKLLEFSRAPNPHSEGGFVIGGGGERGGGGGSVFGTFPFAGAWAAWPGTCGGWPVGSFVIAPCGAYQLVH